MSFLLNLRSGLGSVLAAAGGSDVQFEVRVNDWSKGNMDWPEYRGQCLVTPQFLAEFKDLCERHQCGEKK